MPIATVNHGSVYRFSAETTDGEGTMKALLGGKGAGLAVMAQLGVPVPPGFTIPNTLRAVTTWSTSSCRTQLQNAINAAAVSWLEGKQEQRFGGAQRPLLGERALGRGRIDAGHDGHHPERGPDRGQCRWSGRGEWRPALRAGFLSAADPDVRIGGSAGTQDPVRSDTGPSEAR